jgi:hypothetical protein
MDAAIDDLIDPTALLGALDKAVPQYLDRVDRGDLVYPACKRTSTDVEGNLRSVWEHTRIEGMRYVMMVPRRKVELLIDPARQPEMLESFLRQPPHANTVVDFTGVPIDDFVIAIVAGLNWLKHCAALAGVDREKFSGTLRNFRKITVIAQRWWALEGSTARCGQMLARQEMPPLMLYLVWLEYTRLAKEIAGAAMYGSLVDRSGDREFFKRDHANRSSELKAAPAAVLGLLGQLDRAHDPEDLG